MNLPVWIDSDNAISADAGDVDDAYALSALLLSEVPIAGISSSFGNAPEPNAHDGNKAIAELCNYRGTMVRGASAESALSTAVISAVAASSKPYQFLSLGPMTNAAAVLFSEKPPSEIVFVGSNFSVALPTCRFFDFNFNKDLNSVRRVFDSEIKLTCIPCDVARNLRMSEELLVQMPSTPLMKYLRDKSKRWFSRARRLKFARSVPVWDLVAAAFLIQPELFKTVETTVKVCSFGRIVYGHPQGRPIRVVVDYDPKPVWNLFERLIASQKSNHG